MITRRALVVLAAAAPLLAALITAAPASAAVTGQCSLSTHTCMNRWNGGFNIETWEGFANNDAIQLQWLGKGNGTFQLRDYSGGCIGDAVGNPNDARAGGGNLCPLDGDADWGTVMQAVTVTTRCGTTYFLYKDLHWSSPGHPAYVSVPDGSGNQVYLNSPGGTCLAQGPA